MLSSVKILVKNRFLLGFLSGMASLFFFILIVGYSFFSQGTTISLSGEDLARQISKQVEDEAKRRMPEFITRAGLVMPQEMAKLAAAEFAQTNIDFLGVEFKLPEETLRSIELKLEENFRLSFSNMVEEIKPEVLAKEIGRTAYILSREGLKRQFDGKMIEVRTNHWLTIPVKIEIN